MEEWEARALDRHRVKAIRKFRLFEQVRAKALGDAYG